MDLEELKGIIRATEDKILSLIKEIEKHNIQVTCIDLHYAHFIGDEYGKVDNIKIEVKV